MSLKTEFIEMGEAGDLKGLRDPPQAPAPGLFFLARAGGGLSADDRCAFCRRQRRRTRADEVIE